MSTSRLELALGYELVKQSLFLTHILTIFHGKENIEDAVNEYALSFDYSKITTEKILTAVEMVSENVKPFELPKDLSVGDLVQVFFSTYEDPEEYVIQSFTNSVIGEPITQGVLENPVLFTLENIEGHYATYTADGKNIKPSGSTIFSLKKLPSP